jgi:hypothetical protein
MPREQHTRGAGLAQEEQRQTRISVTSVAERDLRSVFAGRAEH